MSNLYIQIYKKKINIPYTKKYYSILEVLEKNNIKVDFQCRSGYCGVCRTSLMHGKVKYFQPPLACIKNFEILICHCFPITNIEIKL